MPYKSLEDLPENIRKLPEAKQRQWMHVFNSSFDSCSGDDCEGSAIAQANSVVFGKGEMVSSVLFTELSYPDLLEGKPFDGVASGTFTDMYGRKVVLELSELPEYVKNTQNLIEASRTESGELVGLPIDASNHDKGDAAGWIVGVELVGQIIRFVPKWTETGLECLRKRIRRMFSPTLNLSNHAVLGGTLTNWPATRDSRGKVLLRPIELSMGLYAISEEIVSPESKVLQAWRDLSLEDCNLESISSDHVVVSKNDVLYHVDFSESSGKYSFGDSSTWSMVDLAYVPIESQSIVASTGLPETPASTIESLPPKGDKPMIELSQEQLVELAKKVVELMPTPQPTQPPDPLVNLFDLENLSEEAKKQRKSELQAQLMGIRKQAELEYREELTRLAHENSMTELSQKLTQGFESAPRAFRVSSEELRSHLLKLSADEAKFWGELMTRSLSEGFIELGELGSGNVSRGTHKLPEEVTKRLDSKELTLADLSNPILALGDVDQYDLSAWK